MHDAAILLYQAMIIESENCLARRVSSVVGLKGEGRKVERIQAVPIKENRQAQSMSNRVVAKSGTR